MLYILTVLCGLFWSKLFFGFLLFDIIPKIPVLQFIVKALVSPWRQFVIVFVFIGIVEMTLTVYAWSLFHVDFYYYCHSEMWVCYFTVTDWTWKSDAGAGDFLYDKLSLLSVV